MSVDGCSRRGFLKCASGGLALGLALPLDVLTAPAVTVDGTRDQQHISYPIPAADSVSIDRRNQVILVRAADHMYAFALSCPHQNAAVKWLEKDHRFQCSKHDSKYQPTGVYTSGRATRNLDRFPIHREGAAVVIDAAVVFRSDTDPAGWAAATVPV